MDPQYAAIYPQLYRNHWWWRVRERILIATIRKAVTGSRIRILDVGCGDGLFFDALQQFGDVTGIESDLVTSTTGNRWADRIVCGQLDESYIPTAPFDLI